MTALAGLVAFDGGRTITRRVTGAAFVQWHPAAAALPAGETEPLTGADERLLFAALARLDNREELGASLGLGGAELARTSDAQLLLSMHERFGDDGVAR